VIKVFRKKGKEIEEEYMDPEEIREEIKKLEDKIPFFILKDLRESLEGKSITKEQFDQIAKTIIEKVEQSRIDKKIGGMADQVTRLTEGVEAIGKLVSKKPEAIPVDRIEKLDERVANLSSSLESSISSSREAERGLSQRLEEIEKKSFEISKERLGKVEERVGKLSSTIDGLSKDIGRMVGGGDIGKFVKDTIKRIAK
jgi:uncharacterized protein YoxC